ncbi:SUMF1/EgtB/PvdO family nonheme iron enzyme, partial [Mycobacterium tuberculosis]|uniref:SUMF1/EgtB/PvdO family nonheme iron enzyme n=1 Tax=Mycobacterium tuberculosis TaxID=1773 RepID=UPI001435658B|nr:formylglycine-generating enzyme family protein [Mycobacterium tuberculosis]
MTSDDLVWIPAQVTTLCSDAHYPEEAPAREVSTAGFWIQPHKVTNAAYTGFVSATGYVPGAERPVNPEEFPGAPPENLVPGSMVFRRTAGPVDLRHLNLWWAWTPGACWNHPRGPKSSLKGREQHPVVHI